MKLKIYSFENGVDPDQRPADQDAHCFLYNTQVLLLKSNSGIELLENQTSYSISIYLACSKINNFE